ncbi:protein phosphatase 1 regulatory subunit 12A-like isoform X11 [Toxorhynchites rutilus septentrionalis]|uniref:protein phosphatase 1 regulatory subunit 12A-like isoform X11 n=1 Tax=Toxorhynchites rutilus septentrionalis TaxID=329112 RepID=UPI00247945AD|nr:protein phosphatase 1 regulatory subunit 12A-like isoform X11 [Toxorhynchites rutilus septentrionalis]
MSMDNRSSSALFKRAEQLKRWEESETNKHSGVPKSPSLRRIKFSSGCIFLAACVAGDKEEVSRLLETGADIDTANVDGLTALHQACIDDNLDMVEFLVQNGADVNRKDNEGWTPLHATSSCGFLSIARYLIENGADLTAINSDGELALDLACSDAMEDLIQRHIDEQGIDCEDARQAEEKIMLSDAKRWLRSDSTDCDKPHPKTGATAVHVASAKGYIKVLGLLLDGRGDFDKQDVDGWTPLHAAAYWGQKEAVQMLLSANVDIDIQNYSGQQAIDIAQKDIVPLLEEARKNFKRPKRRPASQRITDTIENSIETPTKVIRVEVKPIDNKEKEELVSGSEADEEEDEGENEESEISEADQDDDMELEESAEELDEPKESEVDEEEVVHEGEEEESGEEEEAEEEEEESEPEASVSSISSPYSSSSSSSSTSAESSMTDSETEEICKPVPIISRPVPVPIAEQIIVPKPRDGTQLQQAVVAPPSVPWRRPRAIPTPIPTAEHMLLQQEYLRKLQSANDASRYDQNQVPEKENLPTEPDVILRRTQSFESDEKFYQKYVELRARIQANSCPILPNTNPANVKTAASNLHVQRSASLKDHRTLRKASSNLVLGSTGSATTNVQTTTPQSVPSPPTSPTSTPVSAAPSAGQIRSLTSANNRQTTTTSSNHTIYSTTPPVMEVITVTTTSNSINNNSDSTSVITTTSGSNNAVNKNHSLFELNRKYIEQAQKTKINNERNKFLSSLNEKRQQQLLRQQQQEAQQQQQKAKLSPATEQPPTTKSGPAEKEPPVPPEANATVKTVTAVYAGPASNATTSPTTTTANTTTTSPSPPLAPSTNKLSPGNIFKNFFKSFVPPARDEESETQRKAHAKRVRETRRSTQGVTLDEIKSAEQLVKNKNSTSGNSDPAATTSSAVTATTNTTRSRTIASPSAPINDRVPSVDASGDSSATTEVSPITNTTGSRKTPTSAATAGSPSICDQQVSASFTISPPPSSSMSTTATIKPLRGDGGGGGGGEGGGGGDCTSKNKDGSKISVSYTIATPRLSSSNTMTSHSSSSCEAVPPTAKEIDKEDIPTVTATFSVPSAATTNNNNPNSSNNNFNKKTDTDELTKTKPTIGDYSISSTPASSASVTATIRTPSSVYSAGKRSLFDIDNANSLTLAEKLRQEANKYAESDKENFISSKVSTTGTATTAANSSSGLPTAEAPATIKSDITASNITPAAASEGTVSLRKDTSAPSSPLHHQQQQSTLAERRPSWRMKVDHGAKFKLEDATAAPVSTSATITTNTSNAVTALDSANNRQQQNSDFNSVSSVAQRRHNGDSSNLTAPRPASAPEIGSSADISSSQPQQNDASLHLRRPLKTSEENKENDKENENRSSAQATQAVIQRRRRPKRRSTGVVHVDMEDIDPERQDSPVDGEEKESGTEQAARSRVGSTASELAAANQKDAESKENGGDFIDYKTLYEQAKADNDKLKGTLRKKDEEVLSLKAALDRFTTATTKNNSLSELEKRERRAMERKMSEMEEELKLLQKYKTENERLRAENRALTRVVSKLTTSAQNQLHSKQ